MSETSGGEGSNDDSDEENAAQGKLEAYIIPWSKKKGNQRRSKEAMRYAGQGPALEKINEMPPAHQHDMIEKERRDLYHEHRMSEDITEELTDLKKLAVYKCIRRW